MYEKQIYKLSLLLPIIFPFVCWLFIVKNPFPVPGWIGYYLVVTAMSGAIGGVPYLVIAIILYVWMQDSEPRRIWIALQISPLVMIPVSLFLLLVYLSVTSYESETSSISDTFMTIGPIMAAFILIYGYFYVLLTFALVKIFGKKPIENLPE